MNDAIIQTHDLCYTYAAKQDKALQKQALLNIEISIERGSCAAIIGVTGSGKSTLVQHFNGLLQPTSGTVMVDGVDVGAKGANLFRLRQRVGMLFQFPEAQLFERTVYADVAFGPRRMKLGKHEVRARVLGALEAVGLPPKEFAQRSPFELSGGQMRRAALAGVLAMLPTILVLDEPTTGLDAEGRAEFYYYLRRIQREQDVTVVLVSHDMTEVAELADTIFVMYNARLVLQGTPRTIFSQGEKLREYGLAAPALSTLLAELRQHGMTIPENTFTIDEAFTLLTH